MANNLSTDKTIDDQQLMSLKQTKYGYLYITTNLVNGKKYVGVHKDKDGSNKLDEKYKGSGKFLAKAIEKYGWDNFKTEIIEWYDTKEEMYQAEIDYIKEHNCVNSSEYYNVHDGGCGGVAYINLSEDEYNKVIQKISNAKSNRPRTPKEQENLDRMHRNRIGKPLPESTKMKSRLSNLGQKRSELAKKHMSENHADVRGDKNPAYGRKWINNGFEQLYVKEPELSQRLSDGYVFGKLKKND